MATTRGTFVKVPDNRAPRAGTLAPDSDAEYRRLHRRNIGYLRIIRHLTLPGGGPYDTKEAMSQERLGRLSRGALYIAPTWGPAAPERRKSRMRATERRRRPAAPSALAGYQ